MNKNIFQISIEKPCGEDWKKMTTDANGKFCSSCQKSVIDFTNLSDQQVISLLKNTKGSICGHLSNSQLDRNFKEFIEPKKSYSWLKYAASVLLFTSTNNVLSQEKNTKHQTEQLPVETAPILGEVILNEQKKFIFRGKIKIEDTINTYKELIISSNNTQPNFYVLDLRETKEFNFPFRYDQSIQDSIVLNIQFLTKESINSDKNHPILTEISSKIKLKNLKESNDFIELIIQNKNDSPIVSIESKNHPLWIPDIESKTSTTILESHTMGDIEIAPPKKAEKMDEIKNEEILNHPEDYLRKGR